MGCPGKWKHGLRPDGPLVGLILAHTQMDFDFNRPQHVTRHPRESSGWPASTSSRRGPRSLPRGQPASSWARKRAWGSAHLFQAFTKIRALFWKISSNWWFGLVQKLKNRGFKFSGAPGASAGGCLGTAPEGWPRRLAGAAGDDEESGCWGHEPVLGTPEDRKP